MSCEEAFQREKLYTVADISTAVNLDSRLGVEDINELVQMLGEKQKIHVREDGTFVTKGDFDQVVGAIRIFWGKELPPKLTMVVLSPFIVHFAPDPKVIAAEGSDTQPMEIKIDPKYREVMKTCLPNNGDDELAGEIIDSDLGEKIFTRMVVGTLEELWGKAEALFQDLDREKIWKVINFQWWEMVVVSERYTSAQWHIIARCALLKLVKDEIAVGDIVNTVCRYFNIPTPDEYKDCRVLSFEQDKMEARLPAHRRGARGGYHKR